MAVEYSRFLVPVPASYVPPTESIARLIDAMVASKWLPGRDSPSLNRVRHKVPDRNIKSATLERSPFLSRFLPWLGKPNSSKWICQLPRYVDSPRPIDSAFIDSRIEDGGMLLVFGVSNLDLDEIRYPLARLDYERTDTYFDVIFWVSSDFVYLTSETLEGLENTNCTCGKNLLFSKENDVFAPDDHFPLLCQTCKTPFDPNDRTFRICDGYTGERSEIRGGTVFRFAIEIDCGKCTPQSSVEFARDFRDLCSSMLQCDFQEVESIH